MNRLTFLLTQRHVQNVRRSMFVVLAVAGASIAFCGIQLFQSKLHAADLTDRVKAQKQTLANLRQAATVKPAQNPSPHMDRDAISRLQMQLAASTRKAGCKLNEFQASPDRTPYLSLYTLDTNRPEWEQIAVHVTVEGGLKASLDAIGGMRKCGIPIEPDSIEIVRTDSKGGIATVSVRLVFRVLVQQGSAS